MRLSAAFCLSVCPYFLFFQPLSTFAFYVNINCTRHQIKPHNIENPFFVWLIWYLLRSSHTSTGCLTSYKPLSCLQMGCLALCCFTLQIRPCLHLLHTDNGHYGLPWLTTQVTNQNSQGGSCLRGEKRGSKNWQGLKWRRKKNQHDLQWSKVCVALCLVSGNSRKGNWSQVCKHMKVLSLPKGMRTISVSLLDPPGSCCSATFRHKL